MNRSKITEREVQRYIVATKKTQGMRANDFCFADEGNIAVFGSSCDGGRVDDNCGCLRSMVTPSNAKATTTVEVVTLSYNQLQQATKELIDHYKDGWHMDSSSAASLAKKDLTYNQDLASRFNLGSILEIRSDKIQSRNQV